ncbi:MAG TPA: methyl-accepting chemotaxis protein [Steroidobacteraceae bacterium]|nr:methyl-accepting chemotaxis protein [Steroidobacteraceae bacterium]
MGGWTIRRRMALGFGAILALIIVVESVSLIELARISDREGSLRRDSLPGLEIATRLQSGWLDSYALTVRFLAAPDEAMRARLASQLQAARAEIDHADSQYATTVFRSDERQTFDSYRRASEAFDRIQSPLIARPPDLASLGAVIDRQVAPSFAAVADTVATLIGENRRETEEANTAIQAAVNAARFGILLSFASALVLAAVCAYLLLQSVSRLAALVEQVQKSAIQVNTSLTEIGATANEQQATASEIAATTTEIGATSKEISVTSKELLDTMNEVSAVAEQTATVAGNGQAGLSRMESTMRHVTDAAAAINAKLAALNEKAGNINQVVTTITKVADQTNLLSLNAAIEAEKAGEAGRGFAVVATEIRRLADQTAVATYDIDQTVKEIQSAVAAGVMGMDRFSDEVRRGIQEVQQLGEQLSLIIQQVQTLAPRFVAVNEGMHAQANGAEQISEALSQLSESSQQTVQSLRQSADAIGGLNEVAGALRGAVTRFRLA